MTNKQYNEYIEKRADRSPCFTNCIKAFFTGGFICLTAELLSELYVYWGAIKEDSQLFASLTLIFIAAIFTGIGILDNIARFGGAGVLVPITGFANSMVSSAIEAKSEGLITGVAAKMFNIAGPVIAYGTVITAIYGFMYFLYIM